MLIWHNSSWADYLYWQEHDKRILKRINALIKEVQRHPFEGKGKPEPLKGKLAGFWSRRINEEHRVVYRIVGDDCEIAECKGHYDDK